MQARIRGNIIMAFSNKFGWIALSTGNKSEMSVGYSTLYGDMAGGFAVIKDVPKTLVYRICRYVKDRKSTRLNSSHANISYAVFCLKKKKNKIELKLDI